MSDFFTWLENNKDITPLKDDGNQLTKGLKGSFASASTMMKAGYGAVMDDQAALVQAELDQQEDQQYAGDTENFSDIDSLGSAGDWFAYQAGNAVGSLAQMAAGGGLGGLALKGVAKQAGKEALKRQVKSGVYSRELAKQKAHDAARKVSNIGVMGGAAATGYPQQLGENVMAMRDDRGGYLEDGDVGVAAFTATLQSALDVMPFMSALNKTGLGDKARSEIVGGLANTTKLNQLGKDLGGLALQEGTTEAMQQALQIGALEWVNSNKDHFTLEEMTELMDSFAAGAVGGVVIGGAPAAMNAYQSDSPWLSDAQTERLSQTRDALKQRLNRGENQPTELPKDSQDNTLPAWANFDTNAGLYDAGSSATTRQDDLSIHDVNLMSDHQNLDLHKGVRAKMARDRIVGDTNAGIYDQGASLSDSQDDLSIHDVGSISQGQPLDMHKGTRAQMIRDRIAGDTNAGIYDDGRSSSRPLDLTKNIRADSARDRIVGDTNAGLNTRSENDENFSVLDRNKNQKKAEQGIYGEHTPIELLEGELVHYQGEHGFLRRNKDGTYKVMAQSGDKIVEGGESGLSAEALGISLKPFDFSDFNKRDEEKEFNTVKTNWDKNEINLRGKHYQYVSAASNDEGVTTAIHAVDEHKQPVTFRNPQTVAAIEQQRIEHELQQNDVFSKNHQPIQRPKPTPKPKPKTNHLPQHIVEAEEARKKRLSEVGDVRITTDFERQLDPDAGLYEEVDSDTQRIDLLGLAKQKQTTELDKKAHEAATSPHNDLPEPSDKQKEAGNYKVGKLSLHGLPVAIENPRGSIRKGINAKGEHWQNEMQHHYGYFGGTKGKDGDAVDAFFSSEAENPNLSVFVVDQVNPKTGSFDEHKVMVGFDSEKAARDAYLSNYDKGWKGLGKITPFSLDNFKQWLKDKKNTKTEAAKSKLALPQTNSQSEQKAVTKVEAYKSKISQVSRDTAQNFLDDRKQGIEATITLDSLKVGDIINKEVNVKGVRTYIQGEITSIDNDKVFYLHEYMNKEMNDSTPIHKLEGGYILREGNFFSLKKSNKLSSDTKTVSSNKSTKKETNEPLDGYRKGTEYNLFEVFPELFPNSYSRLRKMKKFSLSAKNTLKRIAFKLNNEGLIDTQHFNEALWSKKPQALIDLIEGRDYAYSSESQTDTNNKPSTTSDETQPTTDLLTHLAPNLSAVELARDIALLKSDGKKPTDEVAAQALEEALHLIAQGKYPSTKKALAQKIIKRDASDRWRLVGNVQRKIKEKLAVEQSQSIEEQAKQTDSVANTVSQPESGLSPIQLATHYAMQNKTWIQQLKADISDANLLLSPDLNSIAMDAFAHIIHEEYSTTPAFKRQAIEKVSDNDKYEKLKKLLLKSSQKRLKEQENESSTTGNLESDRTTNNTQDPALSKPVPSEGLRDDGRSTGRGVEAVTESGVRNQRDQSVPPVRPTASGKRSNQSVDKPDGQSTAQKPATRDSGRGGATDTGTTRKSSAKRGGTESAPDVSPEKQYKQSVDQLKRLPKKAASKPDASFSAKIEQQKQVENIEHKANDLANIQATLPILLPEQQNDVAFAEARFAQEDAHGVLFTNGTGTGKTFTGLGIAKRFARQGKDNILIVVPSDKIAQDWVKSAEYFQLEVKQLKDTQDNGESGAVVTTYANFGANPAILQRDWDLILPDESHRINSNKAGNYTHAERQLNDLSGKNTGDYNYRWKAVDFDKYVKLRKATDKLKEKNGDAPTQYANFRDYFTSPTHHIIGSVPAAFEKLHARWEKLNAAAKKRREKAQKQGIQRAKVTFLSATPFAYHKSLRYADGYLFDSSTYNKGQSGYNVATGFDALLEKEFGYRMRTGKLNQPEADVDVAMGEREFNEKLKSAGVLSGRRLKVDADYSREFVLIDEGVGRKIDEGIRILSEQSDTYPNLSQQLHKNFGYLERLTLLESIKAQAAIDRIKEHLAMGRKVVVFHSYKVAKGINPFDFKPSDDVSHDTIQRFARDHPTIANIHYDTHSSPDYAIAEAFGDQAAVFNGSVDKRQRRNNVDAFNTDGSGVDVIVVQREAGKEGISLHDTTGEHQRVLIDLGLPVRPTDAIQTEGRIYRTGVKTNAIIEYLATGLDYESHAFGQSVAQRSSTAENLALGNEGRNLLKAFVSAYQEANENAPHQEQGVGGKEGDFMNNEVSRMEQAKFEYFKRGKNTKTRANREGKDYFATPEPVGLKMVEWLNLRAGEKALEPSAGHGAIAKWFPDNTKNIFIEQSYSLSGQVSMLGNGEVRTQNFLDFGTNNKFDGIAMNPPYGHGGHDAIEHLEKAFRHLRDGGRVIALIPEGGLATKRFDAFYEKLKDGYLVADVGLPRVAFERAGTAVKTRIVVLDKVPELWQQAGAQLPQSRKLDFDNADNIKELFERIDEISLGERVTKPSDDALSTASEERKRNRKNNETNKPVFSRDDSSITPDTIISAEEAHSVVERFTSTIGKRGIRVELVDSTLDLPLAVHERIAQEGFDAAEVRGVHYDNTAYIVRNQSKHTSAKAIEETIYHEVYGHEGFRRLFGAEIGSKFKHLFGALGGKQGINQLAKQHGFKLDNYWTDWEKSGMSLEHRQLFLVDELLAHLAQKQAIETLPQKTLRKLKELYGAIRSWLRDHKLVHLAQYNDADLQHLLKQARAAVGDAKKKRYVPRFFRNPVFSKAPPSEGLSASGADWSEVDRDAPKQGKERLKELVSKSLQWVKDNAQDFAKSGGLASVTLRQLVDLSQHILPSTKSYMNRVEQMLTARNQMQDDAAQLAQRWQKLDKKIKHRLAHVMHQATLDGNDPTENSFSVSQVLIAGGMDAVMAEVAPENHRYLGDFEAEKVEASQDKLKILAKRKVAAEKAFKNARGSKDNIALKNDAMKRAVEDWRNMRNALAEDEKRQKHFEPLQRLFNDLPKEARDIFADARDMYIARSKRTEEALLKSFEDAQLNRGQKDKAMRLIRMEFETARLKGVYFPLHRKGQFFVRAEVPRDDLTGGVVTYTKKAPPIDEAIRRVTGEVRFNIRGDGRSFASLEEAEAAAGTWHTIEGAMASANSRADLIGKNLVAVPRGDGYVLEDNPNEKIFLLFPTEAEAKRAKTQLEAEGAVSARTGTVAERDSKDSDMLSGSFLGQAFGVMREAGVAEDVQDNVYQLFLEQLPELSQRKHYIHRKKIKGFSEDALQAFSHNMMHQAHQISKLEARDDLNNLLDAVKTETAEAGEQDSIFAGRVNKELIKRHKWVMNPSNAQWTNWTSSFGFIMYLGLSPAAALVNLTQTAVVAYPTLAAEFGWKAATKQLQKASAQLNMRQTIMGDDAVDEKLLSSDEKAALKHWRDAGVIDKSQAHMLAGIGDTDSLTNSPTYQNAMSKIAHLFHKAEIVNREVTLLSAYRLARGRGDSFDKAVGIASDMTWESQFDYSNANRARFMQNDAAKLLLMFKSYSQHMIYYMMRNAHNWGKGGAEGKKAQTRLLGMLTVTAALGGASALPIGAMGLATASMYGNAKYGTKKTALAGAGALSLLFMASMLWDEEEDWETLLRAELRSMGGDSLESLVFRGVVNTATGINVSSRISLDSLLVRDPNRELEGRDLATHYLKEAAGPVLGYGVNLGSVYQLWAEDHGYRATEQLMPKAVRDAMKTARLANEGALNMRGDTQLDSDLFALPYSEEMNLWNLFWQANGFGAEKLSRQYQKNTDLKNAEKRLLRQRGAILRRYYMAYIEKDFAEMRNQKQLAKEWSKKNPKAKPLDDKAFSRSLKTRLRYRNSSMNGVNVSNSFMYLADELYM